MDDQAKRNAQAAQMRKANKAAKARKEQSKNPQPTEMIKVWQSDLDPRLTAYWPVE